MYLALHPGGAGGFDKGRRTRALLLMARPAPTGCGNLDFMELPRAWFGPRNLPLLLPEPGKMGS